MDVALICNKLKNTERFFPKKLDESVFVNLLKITYRHASCSNDRVKGFQEDTGHMLVTYKENKRNQNVFVR